MSKPWMKFYPADWQADPKLRSCSISARGLWLEMICIMQKSEPVGHLLVNGQQPSKKGLATLCGASDREVTRGLGELEKAGVFSRLEDGTLISRRMIRDEERAKRDKANGKRGGNPRVKAGVNPPDNPEDNPEVKAQKPEARVQSSVSNDTGADAPLEPDKKAWQDAVAVLTQQGKMREPQARAAFGKLLSANSLQARDLLPAIAQVISNQSQDPISYLTRAAAGLSQRRAGGSAAPAPAEEITREDWIRRVGMFRKDGMWLGSWGPRPGERGCICPADLLEA